jgi:hypothetical protein
MPMLQEQTSSQSDGYATIRRSKGRNDKKLRASLSDADNNQFEMNEMCSPRRKSMSRKYDFDILYSRRGGGGGSSNVVAFDESSEMDDEGVLNDIESDVDAQSGSSDSHCKLQSFETFKPRNSIESSDDMSDKDLQHSSECFQSLPYDIIMSPLKSPHYINQLNAMRTKAPGDSAKQFALYSRPDSPKYGKLLYGNRSTSPSADSLVDNSSSNSSTYSSSCYNRQPQHTAVFKHTAMSQSLHLPHPQADENIIVINTNSSQSPLRVNGNGALNYCKSFSNADNCPSGDGLNNRISLNSMTMMTKSLYNPSTSSTNLYSSPQHRFATLAHPKEKQLQQLEMTNKSSSSLNDKHFIYLDPILSCKIGSQTILRTKPPIPWWDLAIRSKHRQSCPPMQVNLNFNIYIDFTLKQH